MDRKEELIKMLEGIIPALQELIDCAKKDSTPNFNISIGEIGIDNSRYEVQLSLVKDERMKVKGLGVRPYSALTVTNEVAINN